MKMKTLLGNLLIACAGFLAMASAAAIIATEQTTKNTAPIDTMQHTYELVGFALPNWVGFVLYVLFLIFGTIVSINQPTPVDDKFKHAFLKPIYSFMFGLMVTLLIIPMIYKDITIWMLIAPAMFFAAIGSVVIYYIVAFFTSAELWNMISDLAFKSLKNYLQSLPRRLKTATTAFFGGADDKGDGTHGKGGDT